MCDLPEVLSRHKNGKDVAIRIEGKAVSGVTSAMVQLHQQYGEYYPEVVRTIITDNGADFVAFEHYGSEIYFVEPYFTWNCLINERTSCLLCWFNPEVGAEH